MPHYPSNEFSYRIMDEMNLLCDLNALLEDFRRVAILAGVTLPTDAYSIESLPAPHKPTNLPKGKTAVYVFIWKDICLKVGKAGKNSDQRFKSQHYNLSANSTLSKSIIAAQEELGLSGITESSAGDWIKANVDRFNIVLSSTCGVRVLNLLEAFLQCRLKPRFEGFRSQH